MTFLINIEVLWALHYNYMWFSWIHKQGLKLLFWHLLSSLTPKEGKRKIEHEEITQQINNYTSMPTHTKYAAAVSSGNSPFEPRWAMLYGRDVCRGCLSPLLILLGSGYRGLAEQPTTSNRKNRGGKPTKCHDSKWIHHLYST